MFVHNINPVLFNLGFFEIRFYGIVYVLGFLLCYYILYKKRYDLKLTKRQVDNLSILFLLGLLLGARIFYFIFSGRGILLNNPLEFFKIWNGGMSFYGGFFGSFIASYLYLKKEFIGFADLMVIPISLVLIFGRIANFINGEIVGVVSDVPWCVIFSRLDGICRHPYQIYAAISHTLLFSGLLIVRKFHRKGLLFFSFVAGYAGLRIITDFWRLNGRFLGLTAWQYVSILVLIGTFIFYRKVYKNRLTSRF